MTKKKRIFIIETPELKCLDLGKAKTGSGTDAGTSQQFRPCRPKARDQ